jgi:methyl-accepting chemotaxis protein
MKETQADIPDHTNKLFINVLSANIDTSVLKMRNLLNGLTAYNTALAAQTADNNAVLTQSLAFLQVSLLIIASLVCAAAAFLVIKSITSPINETLSVLTEMAGGNLTVEMQGTYSGEFGMVKKTLNDTIGTIRNMTIVIKQKAEGLSLISSELSGNMTQTAAAVNEITANIQSIKNRVLNQSASVNEANAAMTQIIGNIQKLDGHVETQTNNVTQSSAAIEEMLANIQSVTQTLVRNKENVQELSSSSEIGRNGLHEVAVDIQTIAKESQGLLEINAVMENISSQTNLLSMNAAIEAAHAGEAGKGFAVVAGEIRKLAEDSGKQSKTISSVLKKITTSIDKISASTDAVLTRFEAIDSGVHTVSQQEENIRNAMEEQGTGSKLILTSVGQLNETTNSVKTGSKEMLHNSAEVAKEGRNLEMVTAEITGGMNEMAAGANQVNSAVSQVNELTRKNRESIALLLQEVEKFKVA